MRDMSETASYLPAEVVFETADDLVLAATEIRNALESPMRPDVIEAELQYLAMDVEDLRRWWAGPPAEDDHGGGRGRR
jgi:hypothetical protein